MSNSAADDKLRADFEREALWVAQARSYLSELLQVDASDLSDEAVEYLMYLSDDSARQAWAAGAWRNDP